MATKVFDGNVITMKATADREVNEVVAWDDSIGIVQAAGKTGELISVDTVGVYELKANHDDSISVGNVLYWDDTNKEITTDDTKGNRAGVAWGVKPADTDGVIDVKIG